MRYAHKGPRSYEAEPENQEFKHLFEATGWTRARLVGLMETDPSTVSRWLSGVIHVTPGTLKLLKSMVLLHAPHLITAPVPRPGGPEPLAPWERQCLQSLRELRDEDREKVLALLASITAHLPRRALSAQTQEALRGLTQDLGAANPAERAARESRAAAEAAAGVSSTGPSEDQALAAAARIDARLESVTSSPSSPNPPPTPKVQRSSSPPIPAASRTEAISSFPKPLPRRRKKP